MTEKRYGFEMDKNCYKCIVDTVDEKLYTDKKQVVDRLNELAEENQDNKAMIEFLSTENTQMMNELKTRTQIQHQLEEENEQLKYDNFNLNKTVECLDKTVKEQCNKIDWADECGVRWEEEYNKWIGGKND